MLKTIVFFFHCKYRKIQKVKEMSIRKSLILSMEDHPEEPVELVRQSSVDVVSDLNELETKEEELRDIEEDVTALEGYLTILKAKGENISQETYGVVLLGIDNIYRKYGQQDTLMSFESHTSSTQLIVSLEGLIDKIGDSIKRTSMDLMDTARRMVKGTRKEKEALIKELSDIERRLKEGNVVSGKIQNKTIGALFSEEGKQLTDEKDILRLIENTTTYLKAMKNYQNHRDFYEDLHKSEGEVKELLKHLTGLFSEKPALMHAGKLPMSKFFDQLFTEEAEKANVGEFFFKNKNGLGKASKPVIGANVAYFVTSNPSIFEFIPPFSVLDTYQFGVNSEKSEGLKEFDLLKDPVKVVREYREALEASFGIEDCLDKTKVIDNLREFLPLIETATQALGIVTGDFLPIYVKFVVRWFKILTEAMRNPTANFNARILVESKTLVKYFEKHIAE